MVDTGQFPTYLLVTYNNNQGTSGVLGATLKRRIQPELAKTQAGWKPVAASFELHQGTSCNAIYHRFSMFFNFQLKNRVGCTRVNHPQVPKHQPGWGCWHSIFPSRGILGIPTLSQCRCTTIPLGMVCHWGWHTQHLSKALRCPIHSLRSAGLLALRSRLGAMVWKCEQTRTLWLCQNSYWKWPLIVDFPIKNGDFP